MPDWGLVLGVVSVVAIPVAISVGMTMANPTPTELTVAKALFVGAAILSIGSIVWLSSGGPLSAMKIVVVGALGALTTIGLAVGIDWINGRAPNIESPLKAPTPTPLLIECHRAPLPTTVPPDGVMYSLVPFRMGGGAKSVGFAARTGQPGEKWEWPAAWASTSLNSVRCAITNYGTEPIFSVSLPMMIRYKETIRDAANPGVATTGNITSSDDADYFIAKIDPKTPYVFYTYNQDSDFFEVLLAQRPTTYLKAGATDREQASILPASQTNFGLWPLPKEEQSNPKSPQEPPHPAQGQQGKPEEK